MLYLVVIDSGTEGSKEIDGLSWEGVNQCLNLSSVDIVVLHQKISMMIQQAMQLFFRSVPLQICIGCANGQSKQYQILSRQ